MALDSRKRRKEMRQRDMRESRSVNGLLKRKERARRDASMATIVKAGTLPYTPRVLSWLSAKLNKPGRLITAEDIKKVVA
ncbi:MAG: hypothetical protein K8T89_11585 [Planctomycetes bacterium]|nr:hypothetical protein [Planctomycetota bacterium]